MHCSNYLRLCVGAWPAYLNNVTSNFANQHFTAHRTIHQDWAREAWFWSSAPSVWNSLPSFITNSGSLATFKSRRLKTYFFRLSFDCSVHVWPHRISASASGVTTLWRYINQFTIIIIIFFTRGKPLVAQKLQKKTTKLVWKWTLLWPVVINETIMQQNRIETLHHNGNPLE